MPRPIGYVNKSAKAGNGRWVLSVLTHRLQIGIGVIKEKKSTTMKQKVLLISLFLYHSLSCIYCQDKVWFEAENVRGNVLQIIENVIYYQDDLETMIKPSSDIIYSFTNNKISTIENKEYKLSAKYDKQWRLIQYTIYIYGKIRDNYINKFETDKKRTYKIIDDEEQLLYTYFYDKQQKCIKFELHNPPLPNSPKVAYYIYDKFNRLVKDSTILSAGNQLIKCYDYDSVGNVTIIKPDIEIDGIFTHEEYDSFENLILKQTVDKNDNPIYIIEKIKYKYDEYNNWIEKDMYYYNGNSRCKTTRKIIYKNR